MKSIKQCWAALDFDEVSPVPILKKLEQLQFWFLKEKKRFWFQFWVQLFP
jgi:hypothetical protein